MDFAWVPGGDPDSLLAKLLYRDRVDPPSLDTTLVGSKKIKRLTQLINEVATSSTITRPLTGDLHVVSHGDDSGWLRLNIDAAAGGSVNYQVLRAILDDPSPARRNALSLPSTLYTDSHGAQTAMRVVIAGCRVGKAPVFVDAFKKVLGDKVPVIAARHLHEFTATIRRFRGKRAPPPTLIGSFEYLAYGFEAISPTPLDRNNKGRKISQADFRTALIDAFKTNAKNVWKDGSKVPDANWDPWLPDPLPRDVGKFDARVKASLGQTIGTQTELSPTGNFRHRIREYIARLPHPSAADRTKAGLKQKLLQDKTFQAAWGFPIWEQYGHDTFDEFFDSFVWKPSKPRSDPVVWTGRRHEYILLVPVIDPIVNGNLLFNFFPPRTGSTLSVVRKLSITDPQLFYRTP
jgi:hypothetical protein